MESDESLPWHTPPFPTRSTLAVLKAPQLTTLRLSHNHISELDNMSFLVKLRVLHLDHCHLVRLSAHIKKLKCLVKLDVSYNTIISLALPSRDATASKQKKQQKALAQAVDPNAPPEVDAVVALAYGDNRVWEEVSSGRFVVVRACIPMCWAGWHFPPSSLTCAVERKACCLPSRPGLLPVNPVLFVCLF